MSLKESVRWARPEQLWTEIYTGQDPRCVRVLPVAALRERLTNAISASSPVLDQYDSGFCAALEDLLAELEGLDGATMP